MKAISTSVFDDVETAAGTIANKVKGVFEGLHIQLPHINLPHISVSGGVAPFGIGGKGSLPSFSIRWYARAMHQPMILDHPTVFGMDKSGNWLGGGEAGAEVVYGRNALLSDIREAVSTVRGGFTQNLTVISPQALSPSEVARQTKLANQQMVLRLRTV